MTDFLRDLWRFKPEDSWILLWSLSTGRSEFYTDVEPAIAAANRLAEQGDVYVGAGLRAQHLPPAQRGGTDEVIGIAALWLDVDVIDPAHQKINLFSSKEEAESFAKQVTPLLPSYIIDSGHGLQMWWLFDEPWMFADAEERRSAIDLSRKWSNTFRFQAHQQHLDIDAVHDLSRVMRIPGTFNYKDVARGGERLPVVIREQQYRGAEIARYAPGDFDAYLLDSPETSPDEVRDVGEFRINLMAEPPAAKFDLLQDTSIKFRRSWRHERQDMTDQSLSSYDMSLASLAGHAGWSIQEVVDLVIAHRRRYGETGSHRNMEDYLRRTLRKSMPYAREHIASPDPPPLVKAPRPSEATEFGTAMKSIGEAETLTGKLSILSGMFGSLEITGIIKYRSEPPSYVMDTNFGKIRFDKAEMLTSQTTFRNRVFDATKQMVKSFKRAEWDDLLNTFGTIMDEQAVADDATDEGLISSYLIHYLSERAATPDEAAAFRSQSAFMRDGQLYIFGSAFRLWIYTNYRHLLNSREFGLMMRNIGSTQKVISFGNVKGGRTTRYCWAIPDAIVEGVLGT